MACMLILSCYAALRVAFKAPTPRARPWVRPAQARPRWTSSAATSSPPSPPPGPLATSQAAWSQALGFVGDQGEQIPDTSEVTFTDRSAAPRQGSSTSDHGRKWQQRRRPGGRPWWWRTSGIGPGRFQQRQQRLPQQSDTRAGRHRRHHLPCPHDLFRNPRAGPPGPAQSAAPGRKCRPGRGNDRLPQCPHVQLPYYDGQQFQEVWDSTQVGNALPMAIQVTLEPRPSARSRCDRLADAGTISVPTTPPRGRFFPAWLTDPRTAANAKSGWSTTGGVP